MSQWYVLDGKTPVPVRGVHQWVAERDGSRIVGIWRHKGVTVSTVFLGINLNFGAGPPLLFETMIFGGPDDGAQWRFATWDEAEAHHMATCRTYCEETAR